MVYTLSSLDILKDIFVTIQMQVVIKFTNVVVYKLDTTAKVVLQCSTNIVSTWHQNPQTK